MIFYNDMIYLYRVVYLLKPLYSRALLHHISIGLHNESRTRKKNNASLLYKMAGTDNEVFVVADVAALMLIRAPKLHYSSTYSRFPWGNMCNLTSKPSHLVVESNKGIVVKISNNSTR